MSAPTPLDAPQTAYLPTSAPAGMTVLADEAAHPGKFDDHKGEEESPSVSNTILAASDAGRGDHHGKATFLNAYRSVAFQFLIVGCLAFAGPAQSDAIANLGGGGLATPYTANIANACSYAFGAVVALFGGPIIGKLGLKTTMILGAATFPLMGSSMYCNSAFGNQWYLILGYSISGIGSALWYVSETGIVLSYPESGRRGKFLAWWIVSRNLGQLIGGAINLSVNSKKATSGGIAPKTYLIFVAIECLGFFAAWAFSEPAKVRRKDGTRVVMAPKITFKAEIQALVRVCCQKRILMLLPYFVVSFFYIPIYGTYLSLHFSVRARALSSLIAPTLCIFGCFGLGLVLDISKLSQPARAKLGFLGCVALPTVGICIYTMVVMAGWGNPNSEDHVYDWSDKGWARAYLPFLLIQTFGPMSQSLMFWILSCFAEDVQSNTRNGGVFRACEAAGMAISYGVNSHAGTLWAGMGVYTGLFVLAIPLTWMVILTVPETSPMELRAQAILQQERADAAMDVKQ